MANFLERLVNADKRTLAKIEKKAEEVMALAGEVEKLSQEEMIAKTNEFKERYNNGESLDSLLPEAFAMAREAARRVLNEYPYKVQIMGAIVMHQGDIAEMKTGEGKTLTATMCVYLNALAQKGVHVVTVNEYLAERDATWMGEVYRYVLAIIMIPRLRDAVLQLRRRRILRVKFTNAIQKVGTQPLLFQKIQQIDHSFLPCALHVLFFRSSS